MKKCLFVKLFLFWKNKDKKNDWMSSSDAVLFSPQGTETFRLDMLEVILKHIE